MSNKIGIDLEAVSKNLEESLKHIKDIVDDNTKAIEKMGNALQEQSKKSSNQLNKTADDLQKIQNIANKLNPNSSSNPNRWQNGNRFSWTGAVTSAFGSAINGNFGSAGGTLLGAGAEAIGSTFGPVGTAVGKMVGKIFDTIGKKVDESVDRVQQNWIATHYLKNSLGLGGSVNFNNLYDNIKRSSFNIGGMLNSETIQLFKTVAKASGFTDIASLTSDSTLAGQYGKALGMDVNTSGRFFGQMRATGMATNDAQMRRIGLMIGEGIGKTGAFAKADEMMSAVSSFATISARTTLTANNRALAGYTGMLSGLASGSIKDIAGIAQILSQADSAFRSGGGKGEASWNFRLGAYQQGFSRRITGLEVQYANEQGMFGSLADVVNPNSKYYKSGNARDQARMRAIYNDMVRRGTVGKSNLDVYLSNLKRQTGGGTLMFNALSNDLGTTMSQAIDFYNVHQSMGGTKQIESEIEKLTGKKDLSPEQIINASRYLNKNVSKEELLKQVDVLKSGVGFTNGLSSDELSQLNDAIEKGDKEDIRKVVVAQTATRNWVKDTGERTESAIKDTKNLIDEKVGQPLAEIKTTVAEILSQMMKGEGDDAYETAEGGGDIETDEDGNYVATVGGVPFTIKKGAFEGGSGISENAGKAVATIAEASAKVGIDPRITSAIAHSESGFQNKQTEGGYKDKNGVFHRGSAWGYFQVTKDTYPALAKRLGIPTDPENRKNPYYGALAGALYMKDHLDALKKNGLAQSIGNAYMLHFMGHGGGMQFLKAMRANPNADASAMFRKAAASNSNVYYAKGGRHRTLKEVYDLMTARAKKSYHRVKNIFDVGAKAPEKKPPPPEDGNNDSGVLPSMDDFGDKLEEYGGKIGDYMQGVSYSDDMFGGGYQTIHVYGELYNGGQVVGRIRPTFGSPSLTNQQQDKPRTIDI